MEKKKSINLITLIFFAIVLIILLCICIIFNKMNADLETNKRLVQELKANQEATEYESELSIDEAEETADDIKERYIDAENIELDSAEGKLVSDYMELVYADDGALHEEILEFDNIKNAPKEYLHACVVSELLNEINIRMSDMNLTNITSEEYNKLYYITYEDYNNMLVKIFGEEASGLVEESYMSEDCTKNLDGSYMLSGYCGAESNYYVQNIKEIKKQDDLLYVELYEYKTDFDDEYFNFFLSSELEDYKDFNEYIYNRSGDVIATIKHKILPEESKKKGYACYDKYYEDGTKVDEEVGFNIEKLADKMSVRAIELKYNEEDNSLTILRNKLFED